MKSAGGDYARARQCNFPTLVFPKHSRGPQFRNGGCAPKPGANKIQTRLAIARATLRLSRLIFAGAAARSLIGPAIGARVRRADLIQNPPDHGVEQIEK